jgi:hypothetical protein
MASLIFMGTKCGDKRFEAFGKWGGPRVLIAFSGFQIQDPRYQALFDSDASLAELNAYFSAGTDELDPAHGASRRLSELFSNRGTGDSFQHHFQPHAGGHIIPRRSEELRELKQKTAEARAVNSAKSGREICGQRL